MSKILLISLKIFKLFLKHNPQWSIFSIFILNAIEFNVTDFWIKWFIAFLLHILSFLLIKADEVLSAAPSLRAKMFIYSSEGGLYNRIWRKIRRSDLTTRILAVIFNFVKCVFSFLVIRLWKFPRENVANNTKIFRK